MSESIYLSGSEDISHAGYAMQNAADSIHRAVDSLDAILRMQRAFMEDWLLRLQQTMEELK